MLRKALTLGMVFILTLSLLLVSVITCFTYDAQADEEWHCTLIADPDCEQIFWGDHPDPDFWTCVFVDHGHPHTGE